MCCKIRYNGKFEKKIINFFELNKALDGEEVVRV